MEPISHLLHQMVSKVDQDKEVKVDQDKVAKDNLVQTLEDLAPEA
jgi:hypothetical protein